MAPPAIRDVLLDRDGTIIEERHYLCDPDGVALVPGGGEALGRLVRAGKRIFCVTNQSGIGRGYYTRTHFQAVQARLESLLAPFGAKLTETAFCPHAPTDACACRKPATGMFEALTARHGLDPATTALIGDAASDIAFGLAFGAAVTILVMTGHGRRDAAKLQLPHLSGDIWVLAERQPGWPHVLARDLSAAVDFLLDAESAGTPSP